MNGDARGQGGVDSRPDAVARPGPPEAALEVPLRAGNVIDLFSGMVVDHPMGIAISHAGQDVDYRSLDARARRIAADIVGAGVPAGSIVALFLDDPVDQVAATLACMRAGCVFASLDTTQPSQRLRHMIDVAAPAAALVRSSTAAAFAALVDGSDLAPCVLVVDGAPRATSDAPAASVVADGDGRDAPRAVDPDDPCYLYFTSGSTGRPKAILGRTRGLAHFIQWEIAAFGLGPGSRISQLTGPSFDVYLRDVFAPLCAGGTLCIPERSTLHDPAALERWIEQSAVTLVHCVPSVFRLLLQREPAPDRFPALRYVLLAGEALPAADANAWIRRFGARIRLANLYGPTETTLAKFCHLLPDEPVRTPFVPIGTPIPGARVVLLGEDLSPVPPGEAGEIHIGTPYRSLGYHLAPDLTAAAFIDDPTGTGGILYRTGDLGRLRPDGNVEFIGRKDFQVKIRGNRVEPGEIEARLRDHPAVREAVVVAREDRPGDLRLVAYVVLRDGGANGSAAHAGTTDLRRHVAECLPDYMVPAHFVELERMPLSANGKLDRASLPPPGEGRPDLAADYAPPRAGTEARICALFADALGIAQVGRHDNFFEAGGNSLLAAGLLDGLRELAGRDVASTLVFAHPTPAALAAAVAGTDGDSIEQARLPRQHRHPATGPDRPETGARGNRPEPIAIIAMAGRFPGAADVEQFWGNLCAGRDTITRFGPDELDPSIPAADRLDPDFVPARGVIDGVEMFDAAFFGINPGEARLMDPQHRVFLELCWECMERGGHAPDGSTTPVGVFAGTYHATYLQRHVLAHPDLVEAVGAYQVTLANEKDYIATRIAHKLDLTGPAISMYTACSTSLVAICQAVDSLRAGSCDMALAGGASIVCPPRRGHRYQEGAMFSPDGHTRTFDARAQGTVFSDGAAVVLLKRLSDALRDGNPVHAVILGTAVNNDGGRKASFTAPSSQAQSAVIALAQDNARVPPRSIGYVEAHGTATPVGDPIEIEGLTRAFRRGTGDTGFCRIGSVKSNVGHLVIAAGAAGVIKTAMSLSARTIPASLHYESANPAIDFADSPFVVNDATRDWPAGNGPRRAGVSSFGVGGTNAHVVLEEAPSLPDPEPATGPQLIVLSARTPTALAQAASRLAGHLERMPGENLADVAWTLSAGRKAMARRLAIVASDAADAAGQLRGTAVADAAAAARPARERDVVFLFPGQGATYPGMGRELLAAEPGFAAAFEECMQALDPDDARALRARMSSDDPEALLPTAVMQPATFVLEYALARNWMELGLAPTAMIGHSIGEFVAATLAGVFPLRDALRLVARRGALMQALPPGGMLSVRLPADTIAGMLPADVSLAAENAPASCVVAGTAGAVAAFQANLEASGIACRALRTSHAFHSGMMDPVVAPFRAEVARLDPAAPRIPVVSTSTGDWLDAATACSADYWASHLRAPVRFASALSRVLDAPSRVLLEVGPRGSLCALARQHPDSRAHGIPAIPTLADDPATEVASLRLAAGRLWSVGTAIDPGRFDRRTSRRRLCLPTYPFERERYWVDAAPAGDGNVRAHPVLADRASPIATVGEHQEARPAAPSPVVAAVDDGGLLARLREMFREVSGVDIEDDDRASNFIELGLDSLVLTQVATRLQKTFAAGITFRQLMGECASLERLAATLAERLPAQAGPDAPVTGVDAARRDIRRTRGTSRRAPMDSVHPTVPGARLGREPDGRPAWFVDDSARPGKYLKVGT